MKSIKAQLVNQEYMMDIRTKALQQQDSDKNNMEYQL